MALLAAPVFVLSAVYLVRFRHGRRADRSCAERSNVWLETSWALIPFLMVMGFYVWSTRMFLDQQSPPADALTVDVVAKQWMWKFQHTGGQREINELHVPLGRAIRLTMTSEDVIHSLYLPALRIKQDVLPGRYTQEWFAATRAGVFPMRCAEYCGTDHSVMGGRVIVQTPAEFARWQAQAGTGVSLVQKGAALYARLGCAACHGGAPGQAVAERAPPLAGLYGRAVPLADGTTVRADEQYLHDAIVWPARQVVAGYAPIMPPYGQALDEEQVAQLAAYIRSLGGAQTQ